MKRIYWCVCMCLFSCGKTPCSDPKQQVIQRPLKDAVLYRSSDQGKTWASFASGIPQEATISSITSTSNSIFVSTKHHGVFISENGINQWQQVHTGLPEGVEVNALAVQGQLLVAGTFKHGIYISPDLGRNWLSAKTDLASLPIRSLFFAKDRLYAATDRGVYASMDEGETWSHQVGTSQVNGFTFLNDKIYAGGVGGAMMSVDGNTWKYIYDRYTLHDISNDNVSVYAMTMGEGLLKTRNDGLEWENVNNGLGKLYTFDVIAMDMDLLAGQWHGIYLSSDGGGSWSLIKNGLPDSTAFPTLEVTAFGILAGMGLRK
jgi:photosystem II stability/assembly factor-like uncharacterized protein